MIDATQAFAARARASAPTASSSRCSTASAATCRRRWSAEGYRVRVYVPFGQQWFPYFMRRLGERPANVGFVLRGIVKDQSVRAGRRRRRADRRVMPASRHQPRMRWPARRGTGARSPGPPTRSTPCRHGVRSRSEEHRRDARPAPSTAASVQKLMPMVLAAARRAASRLRPSTATTTCSSSTGSLS